MITNIWMYAFKSVFFQMVQSMVSLLYVEIKMSRHGFSKKGYKSRQGQEEAENASPLDNEASSPTGIS